MKSTMRLSSLWTTVMPRKMSKTFYVMHGIGAAKYVVNFHDGVSTHKDGSPFYDIRIFKSKKKMDAFIGTLLSTDYKQR